MSEASIYLRIGSNRPVKSNAVPSAAASAVPKTMTEELYLNSDNTPRRVTFTLNGQSTVLNYTNWGKKLGIDLVGNPKLAEQPEVAAKILVGGMKEGSFTGKGLNDYINGSKTDFVGARRIVNGTDKASTFASTAQAILGAMN